MIRGEDVFKIGKFIKPHGIKGEIVFAFEKDIFAENKKPCLICKIDDIFVPFFVESFRYKGSDSALVILDGVETDSQARPFSGLEVYYRRKDFQAEEEEEDYTLNFFIGFKVIDATHGELGTIREIDEQTINTLFLVQDGDNEFILPAVEEFIESVDPDNRVIYFNLPDGLIG